MLGNYQVAAQLVASRGVLSSTELVIGLPPHPLMSKGQLCLLQLDDVSLLSCYVEDTSSEEYCHVVGVTIDSLDWYLHLLYTYSSQLQVTITIRAYTHSAIHYDMY
jgi:hypothetical protein